MFGAYVDINSLAELEDGIHTFDRQMAEASRDIEHSIDLYFQDFERGLQILEERLRQAEEDLERAERALERQRNKRVWVEDRDGEGHWERADCSAEEARVARCQAICNRCRRDVDACRRMISDARSKRHALGGKYALFEGKNSEALERLRPIREKVEKHRSIQVPPSFSSSGASRTFPTHSTSASAASILRGEKMSRPRPPMPSGISYGPKNAPAPERPRAPLNDRVNPAPSRPITEADRPRSPFGDSGRSSRNSASSFWDNLDKVFDK